MITVRDIIGFVEGKSGHPIRGDEGVQRGTEDDEVSGVTVCWMATADAIADAGTRNDSLLVAHESLYYPYDVVISKNPPKGWETWPVNRGRRERLERHNLTFMRLHGSLDDICIFDDFAATLGLGKPVVADGTVTKIFEIEECTLDDLVSRVKERTGMNAVRVSGPVKPGKKYKRIGLPWGGLGLFVNVAYQQSLLRHQPDIFISGESDNYGFRFAEESGIPTIETGHEISENPGLKHFTQMLVERFPDTQFTFYENPPSWKMR